MCLLVGVAITSCHQTLYTHHFLTTTGICLYMSGLNIDVVHVMLIMK